MPSALRTSPRQLRRLVTIPLPSCNKRHIGTATAAVEDFKPESFPTQLPARQERIRSAKPFSEFLTDTHNRQHDYLRISLTERCNLRCLYCMPEEGVDLSPDKDILTSAEIEYLSALFVSQGVTKIRLTGGEPTVRKDILPLMRRIGALRRNGLKELALTTNGISLHRKLDDMVESGLTGVNISLDTLDPFQYQILTRRAGFNAVMKSIDRVKGMNKLGAGVKLKINCVVMRGLNDHQILPFVDMTREEDVEVRFIEYMPFGGNKWSQKKMMSYEDMLQTIRAKYPTVARLQDAKNDTSKTWQVPGFVGRLGFITSMTHNFCGTCNRLRITSDGNLKVCLHGNSEVSLRDMLRQDHGGEPMDEEAFDAVRQLETERQGRPDLYAAEEGQWTTKEQQLLDIIGAAVKRKQAKHAGIGELEKMKNRPMILIAERKSQEHSKLSKAPRRPQYSAPGHIPTHLLSSRTSSSTQVRFYSSNQGSSFGFQSLKTLLPTGPAPNRYSRSREEKAEFAESPVENAAERTNDEAAETTTAESGDRGELRASSFLPLPNAKRRGETSLVDETSTSRLNGEEADSQVQLKAANSQEQENGANHSVQPTVTPSSRRRRQHPGPAVSPRDLVFRKNYAARESRPLSRPQEPLIRTHMADGDRLNLRKTVVSQAGGVGRVSRPTFVQDAVIETVAARDAWGLESDTDNLASQEISSSPSNHLQQLSDRRTQSESTGAGPRLTHITPTGEARMVDVGSKASTRRVAIASCSILFSNDTPYRLLTQGANPKGDVLGAARIAGIMGAKRTSDLIPLCHPIALTKAEVEVSMTHPNQGKSSSRGTKSFHEYGGVKVVAVVECVGQTGVEMEALTAASTAALTVYDMCKAVDRAILVERLKVVYKSGGRSGLSVDDTWAKFQGAKFFKNRQLELPHRNNEAAMDEKKDEADAEESVGM